MATKKTAKKTTKASKTSKAAKSSGGNGRSLVIVESPAKARTINKYLGNGFEVQASMGHVRDLPKKELGIDEEHGFAPKYVQIPGKNVQQLRRSAQRAKDVYLAPDPDREGEAIAWHLAEALKVSDEKVHRVTFNEITERAVKDAFQHPRPIDMSLVNAQQARRILDRIVGYKLSPLLWKKITKGLSAGRVQSVAVRLLVEREDEVQAFKPEEYWVITALFPAEGDRIAFYADLRARNGKKFVPSNEEEAMAVVNTVENQPFNVASIEQREAKNTPAPPFATSQLQQAASTRLGFTASRTMAVAQALYQGEVQIGGEGVGLITYMRTDSFRIAPEALQSCRQWISTEYGDKYLPEKPNMYRSRRGAQEAHECIRPTDVRRDPESLRAYLTREQYRLYELIWRRFVASQMTPARFLATTADLACGEYTFRATGRVQLFDGHLKVSGRSSRELARITAQDAEKGDEPDDGDEEESTQKAKTSQPQAGAARSKARDTDQRLPDLKEGQELTPESIDPQQKFTKPPARFTEATLVKTLEREGIGRPSTYAQIVQTIQERGYVVKEGRQLKPTELGTLVTRKLLSHFASIMDYGFTRQMEEELDRIEESKVDWVQVLTDFNGSFIRDLESARENMQSVKGEAAKTEYDCPKCGGKLMKKYSRYGAFLGCSNYPACEYRAQIGEDGKPRDAAENITEVVCDECGGRMVEKRSRFGPFLGCENYPNCKNTMRLSREGKPVQRPKPPSSEPIAKCEKCGSDMIVRLTRRGGRLFIGCTKYPKCRQTHPFPPPEEVKMIRELTPEEQRIAEEVKQAAAEKEAKKKAKKAGGKKGKDEKKDEEGRAAG